ncbi:MAG: alpha/beta hydrolase family protein [Acidimicrobiales bacterium]
MATRTWDFVDGPCGALAVHVAPDGAVAGPSTSVVILCHDFPAEQLSAERTGRSLPVLGDRLAAESDWRVVAGCLRGVGASVGDFSLCGWLEDLRVILDHAAALASGGGVWVVGFGVTGALALCLAADDRRVRGVGSMGAPATFADWAQDPKAMLGAARRVGVVRGDDYPPDVEAWARQFTEISPVAAAARLGGRPLLVVHGADDDEVPASDARTLVEAAGTGAELRVLQGAGHRLRADPRAIALLVGWLERQAP